MEDEKLSTVQQHLLSKNEDNNSKEDFEHLHHRERQHGLRALPVSFKALIVLSIIAYVPLIILYISLSLHDRKLSECLNRPPSDLFPSLAESSAFKYETRIWPVKLRGNPFVGDPRPELEIAWHELFEKIRISATQEDLDYYNLTSLPLADGSGYAAELGVFHELHCLKKIRHYIYKDHYLVNETSEELVEWKSHIDHCVEMLREAIMCRGDPSLTTFKWLPRDPPAFTAVAEGHHRCVNWENLLTWVRERAVPIFEEAVIISSDP